MNKILILAIAALCSCRSANKEIKELTFPYKKNFEATYFTKSIHYHPDNSIRFQDSAFLTFRISDEFIDDKGKIHEWLLLPGSQIKNIPDTMYTLIDKSGLIDWYAMDILDRRSNVIILPLKKDTSWNSYYLTYPAKASCISIDTTTSIFSKNYECFLIQYEFSPDYMNDFLQGDSTKYVRAIKKDFYSMKHGLVKTELNYFVTERTSGRKLYRILHNKILLKEIKNS
jgi:hypothetical protein